MGLKLLGFIIGLALGCSSQQTCPPASSIAPCYCQGGLGDGRLVECDRVESLTSFQTILSSLKGLKINTLEIYKANLDDKSLPYDLFSGLTITKLIIKNSFFNKYETSVGQLPFSGLEGSLVNLRLVDNKVANPSPILLPHLRYLASLDITGYDIPSLTLDWFRYPPPALRYLALNRNGIRQVDPKAFSRIQNLEVLELLSNEITTLDPTVFPNSLLELHLNMNQLTTLSVDAINALPRLQLLDLSSNMIKSLPESIWGELNHRVYLELAHNPLHCTEEMLWVSIQKRSFSGTCDSPTNLRGTELSELKTKFHSQ